MLSAPRAFHSLRLMLKSQLLFATFPDLPLPPPDRISHFLLCAPSLRLHANIIFRDLTTWLGVLALFVYMSPDMFSPFQGRAMRS